MSEVSILYLIACVFKSDKWIKTHLAAFQKLNLRVSLSGTRSWPTRRPGILQVKTSESFRFP